MELLIKVMGRRILWWPLKIVEMYQKAMAHRARSIQKSKKMTNGNRTIAIATLAAVRRHEKNKFVYQVFFIYFRNGYPCSCWTAEWPWCLFTQVCGHFRCLEIERISKTSCRYEDLAKWQYLFAQTSNPPWFYWSCCWRAKQVWNESCVSLWKGIGVWSFLSVDDDQMSSFCFTGGPCREHQAKYLCVYAWAKEISKTMIDVQWRCGYTAIWTDDIIKAVSHMKQRGCNSLSIPSRQHDNLRDVLRIQSK